MVHNGHRASDPEIQTATPQSNEGAAISSRQTLQLLHFRWVTHSGEHSWHNSLGHAHCARHICVHDLLKILQRLLHQRPCGLHPCSNVFHMSENHPPPTVNLTSCDGKDMLQRTCLLIASSMAMVHTAQALMFACMIACHWAGVHEPFLC